MEPIRSLLLHRLRPSPDNSWVGSCIISFVACSAFTRVTTCRLAKSPYATLSTGGSGGFVASTAAPIATGWSDPVPGRVYLPLWSSAFHGALLPPVYPEQESVLRLCRFAITHDQRRFVGHRVSAIADFNCGTRLAATYRIVEFFDCEQIVVINRQNHVPNFDSNLVCWPSGNNLRDRDSVVSNPGIVVR